MELTEIIKKAIKLSDKLAHSQGYESICLYKISSLCNGYTSEDNGVALYVKNNWLSLEMLNELHTNIETLYRRPINRMNIKPFSEKITAIEVIFFL